MKKILIITALMLISLGANAAWNKPSTWIGGGICETKYIAADHRKLFESKSIMRSYRNKNAKTKYIKYGDGKTKHTLDEYTGDWVPNIRLSKKGNPYYNIHVDHVISISEIWAAGGCNWSKEQRTAFKRDTANFKITSAKLNTSKGAAGPKGTWFEVLDDKAKVKYLEARHKVTSHYPELKLPKFRIMKLTAGNRNTIKIAKVVGKTGGKFFVIVGAVTTGYEIYLFVEDPDKYIKDTKTFWTDLTAWVVNTSREASDWTKEQYESANK